MEQRQLRLGDILDDYCPRERRITNHAVVAMVGSDVKQTRCTTCDAEHAYKAGKIPPQRKKKDAVSVVPPVPPGERPTVAMPPFEDAEQPNADAAAPAGEEGRAHRPLIRATLPRTVGQTTPRPVPEFTIRQAAARHGKFHGHAASGGHHADRPKGRAQAGHSAGARVPGGRPSATTRHANRPGHSPHGAPAHPPRHSHSGPRSRNKRPR